MRLLVSVANAAEASAALLGGADIIDAKDPHNGALGAVSGAVLREIRVACAGARPLTAALGDATTEAEVEQAARDFCTAGAALVKVGFAGIACARRVESLIAAAVRGARSDAAVPLKHALSARPSAFAEASADRRSAKRGGWSTGSGRAVEGPETTYDDGVVAVAYADAASVG